MTFYLLFIFLTTSLVGLSYLYPNYRKVFQIVLLVLVLSVAGFRDYIGVDFRSYVDWYVYKQRDYDFEFGFVWIMNLFRWLHCSYHILFFFFSFCTVLLVFLGTKKYTVHSDLAFLFFLLIPALYLNSWSILRQAFAVSMAFYAFHFLISKKYLIYLVLMCVGIAVHYTSIVPFLIFLVVYKCADKIKTFHLSMLLLLSLVLSHFHLEALFISFFEKTRYLYYFSGGMLPINSYKIISLNMLAVFVLFYFDKMKAVYPVQKYLMILCVFSIIVTNLFSTASHLNRFSHYFTVFEIVVFADLIFLEFKRRRVLLLTGLYLYGVGLFLYNIKADYKLNKQGTKYVPYNSVFYKFDTPFFMMGTDYLIDPPEYIKEN